MNLLDKELLAGLLSPTLRPDTGALIPVLVSQRLSFLGPRRSCQWVLLHGGASVLQSQKAQNKG